MERLVTLSEIPVIFAKPTPNTAITDNCVKPARLCKRQFTGLARLPFSLRSL
jgi:hypothetical protein